jgi:PHD/YefM family antitoxin component YafN of YafNO toxin-antitoxin module
MGDRSRGQMTLQIPARKRRFSMTNVKLPASEFQDHVGEAFDRSLSQPVVIPKHGRPNNVVSSYGEYERLSAYARRAARVEDLSDDELAPIGGERNGARLGICQRRSLGRAKTRDRSREPLRRVCGTGRSRRNSPPPCAPNRSNSPGRAV